MQYTSSIRITSISFSNKHRGGKGSYSTLLHSIFIIYISYEHDVQQLQANSVELQLEVKIGNPRSQTLAGILPDSVFLSRVKDPKDIIKHGQLSDKCVQDENNAGGERMTIRTQIQ